MFVPKLFTTLKGYNRKQLLADSGAGIIVALIAFPLSIALGVSSGVTPEVGLYTAVIGCTVVAVLGGSRVQVAGPTGAFVVVVAGIIGEYGLSGLALATIMAGLLLILLGLARMGDVISMIPYPITTGFTSGIAVTIALTQLRDFFGLPAGASLLTGFAEINWWAPAIALASLLILRFWPKLKTPLPPALAAITAATLAVLLFDLPVETIGSRFGSLSTALPRMALPEISLPILATLWKPAVTIAALAAIESLLSAVVADGMIGGNHRSNMELVAQGAANTLSGLFGGIPVTGAIARTAANVRSGGRTPVAALVSGVFLFIMLQLLLPLAARIPMSSLAAVLLMVAYGMGEWGYFTHLRRAPKSDYLVFIATFALTVVFDLVVGILVGMLLAVFLFMKRMADVSSVELISENDEGREDRLFEESPKGPGRGAAFYRIRGPFFFGAAEKFLRMLRRMDDGISRVTLDLSGVPAMDATAFRALEMMADQMERRGGRLVLSGLNPQPKAMLGRYGFFGRGVIEAPEE